MRKIALFLLIGLLGFYAFPSGAIETKEGPPADSVKKASELSMFEVKEEDGALRLLISANGKIESYRSFFLDKPLRLVIDIPNVALRQPQKFISVIHPIIEVIRLGQHQDKVRLVIDFRSTSKPPYQISQTDNSLLILIKNTSGNQMD